MKTITAEEKWLTWIDELSYKDYVIIDDFLDEVLYINIKSLFEEKLGLFTQAGIGSLNQHTVETAIRGDKTYWLDKQRDTEIEGFWEVVEQTVSMFNRYCYLSLSGYEFHFAKYPPGSHYHTHLDQFQNRNNRTISMILYLNEDWQPGDGGELEVFNKDESSFLVPPLRNRCVMFKSAVVPHGVLESHKNRYSLTGWLLQRPHKLGAILG